MRKPEPKARTPHSVMPLTIDAIACSRTPKWKFRIFRPTVIFLGVLDLFVAQRLAVSRRGILFGRRAKGDVAVDHDKRRPVVTLAKVLHRPIERVLVVGVGDM